MKDEITKDFGRKPDFNLKGEVNAELEMIRVTGYALGEEGLRLRKNELLEIAFDRGQISFTRRPRPLHQHAADLLNVAKEAVEKWTQPGAAGLALAIDKLRSVIARIEGE